MTILSCQLIIKNVNCLTALGRMERRKLEKAVLSLCKSLPAVRSECDETIAFAQRVLVIVTSKYVERSIIDSSISRQKLDKIERMESMIEFFPLEFDWCCL